MCGGWLVEWLAVFDPGSSEEGKVQEIELSPSGRWAIAHGPWWCSADVCPGSSALKIAAVEVQG